MRAVFLLKFKKLLLDESHKKFLKIKNLYKITINNNKNPDFLRKQVVVYDKISLDKVSSGKFDSTKHSALATGLFYTVVRYVMNNIKLTFEERAWLENNIATALIKLSECLVYKEANSFGTTLSNAVYSFINKPEHTPLSFVEDVIANMQTRKFAVNNRISRPQNNFQNRRNNNNNNFNRFNNFKRNNNNYRR